MGAADRPRMLAASGPRRSSEAEYQDERQARIDQMLALALKHSARATLRRSDGARIVRLYNMLERLHSDLPKAHSPERDGHLGEPVLDLETMIVRACLRRASPR